MLFKTDENLPVEITDLLQKQGHDAISVHDQHLGGNPTRRLRKFAKRRTGS